MVAYMQSSSFVGELEALIPRESGSISVNCEVAVASPVCLRLQFLIAVRFRCCSSGLPSLVP